LYIATIAAGAMAARSCLARRGAGGTLEFRGRLSRICCALARRTVGLLLLADHDTFAARPCLVPARGKWVGRRNDPCVQPALREIGWIQGHDEVGVGRFSALAEWGVVSIREVRNLLENANELTLLPNESDNRSRRANVESLEHLDVLRQNLFREKPHERWRFCPRGDQRCARIG
jgi:hypothetical protein